MISPATSIISDNVHINCIFKEVTQRENFPPPLAHCAYWQGLSDRSSQPALSLLSSPDLSRHGTSEHAPPCSPQACLAKRGSARPQSTVCTRAHTAFHRRALSYRKFSYCTTIHTRSSMAIADGCI